MSSIFSSGATAAASPFAATRMAPTPGNGSASRFESIFQSSGSGAGFGPSAKTAAQKAQPMDSTGGSSVNSDDSGSVISANDFLTLLVTEMQNQDPTADTDPNEYINQLVQINSLEQLISINQNLSTVLGTASAQTSEASTSASEVNKVTVGNSPMTAAATGGHSTRAAAENPAAQNVMGLRKTQTQREIHGRATGNLSMPTPSAASRAVAHSLDGHVRAARTGHAIRDIPTQTLPR